MDPDPDPTLDPTPFFSDFKDVRKMFPIFFSYYLPAGTLSSVLKIEFFAKILSLNFIFKALFQSAQHLYMRQGKDPGGPKTRGSGSPTLALPYLLALVDSTRGEKT
jgi:hypothetical protein